MPTILEMKENNVLSDMLVVLRRRGNAGLVKKVHLWNKQERPLKLYLPLITPLSANVGIGMINGLYHPRDMTPIVVAQPQREVRYS